jgi:hypothetical protein
MLNILRFFSSKCRLFHNATFFGSCIIQILHTGCAKNLKKIWRQRGNKEPRREDVWVDAEV